MGTAYDPPAQEQILNIGRIQTAIGNPVNTVDLIPDCRIIRLVQHTAHGMDIHRPAAVSHCVLKIRILQTVLFRQHIIPQKPPAFPFARKETNPLKIQILRMMSFTILDMIPYAEDRFEQIIPDIFRIRNGIVLSVSKLDPPISGSDILMVTQAQLFLRISVCPERFFEGHWVSHVSGQEHDRVPHRYVVLRLRRQMLSVSILRLSSHPVHRTRPGAKSAVSCRIHEQRGPKAVLLLCRHLLRPDLHDLLILADHLRHMRV